MRDFRKQYQVSFIAVWIVWGKAVQLGTHSNLENVISSGARNPYSMTCVPAYGDSSSLLLGMTHLDNVLRVCKQRG